MDLYGMHRFLVVCRRRDSREAWGILSWHELREQAASAADIYASREMSMEAGIFELITIMRTNLRTDVENFR
jgi:hypothetical protein